MSKLKYFQALRVEQLNHEIKAMQYELDYYQLGATDDYWLTQSKTSFRAGWAISDAIKNIFGEKYYADTNLNDENKGLLHQWCELYFQVKDLKEKMEIQS